MARFLLHFEDNAEIARRFPDLHPAFSRQEALTEANRCLNCFDAPCAAACPTHIDVPRFIKKIATRKPDGFGAHHSGREHSGCKLFARLPGGGAVRRRLRDAAL